MTNEAKTKVETDLAILVVIVKRVFPPPSKWEASQLRPLETMEVIERSGCCKKSSDLFALEQE